MIAINFKKTNIFIKSQDPNVSNMIYEKCLKLKEKNDEILKKTLNLRLELSR